MKGINHFYVCLGCEARHPTDREAKTCCAVVQEVWECSVCGKYHARPASAESCLASHKNSDVKESRTIRTSAANSGRV